MTKSLLESTLRLATCALFVAAVSTLEAQITKQNLDLPYDAIGDGEDEEDAPEIVTFYGTTLEGDGFFYVIDRSGSMQTSGELQIAKREVTKNITEFSDRVQFGIFFIDAGLKKFPAGGQPAEANPGMKGSAISFLQATQGGSGSCCQAGFVQALRMANQASAPRKVIVYVGDGGGTCNGADETQYLQQTLGAVSAQNYQRAIVNTIGVLDVNQLRENFLRALAGANGGTYTLITK